MYTTFVRSAALVMIAMRAAPLAAQTAPSPELVAACVQSQQQAMLAADAANRRLELARQTNQAATMRAAMDDLQGALSAMRTQLAPCATLQAAVATAADAHAGHVTPAEAPAPRPTMVMVQTAFDPIKLTCSPKIDPKAAAKATHQGKTYYFCSVRDRDEFLTDPAMSLSMMPPKQ